MGHTPRAANNVTNLRCTYIFLLQSELAMVLGKVSKEPKTPPIAKPIRVLQTQVGASLNRFSGTIWDFGFKSNCNWLVRVDRK